MKPWQLMLVLAASFLSAGCQDNSQRARDYKICKDAGMDVKIIGADYAVICVPPPIHCK